jgi:hypothetical protein
VASFRLPEDIETDDPIQDSGKGEDTPKMVKHPSPGIPANDIAVAGDDQPSAKPSSPSP